MDLAAFYNLIDQFVRTGHLPAFLTGAFLATLLMGGMFRALIRRPRGASGELRWWKERCEALERENKEVEAKSSRKQGEQAAAFQQEMARGAERLGAVERESALLSTSLVEMSASREEVRLQKADLSKECERLKADGIDLAERLDDEVNARKEAEEREARTAQELDNLVKSEIKIWDRPIPQDVPKFRPLSLRGMPIVSVLNLKGGVGKTTITMNLGAALARRGYRVLMVDLDFQGSLTSRSTSPEDYREIHDAHRFVWDVFRDDLSDRAFALTRSATKIRDVCDAELTLVACEEEFEAVETRMMMNWHVGAVEDDVRFRLRQALHAPVIAERYDIVLLDCPPRLTTGCVNALTSSDQVLIPVLLDETSAEAVPRLLKWLKKLRVQLCPELSVLGVVGNKAYPRARLIQREQQVWNNLKRWSELAWGGPVRHFDEVVIRQHATLTHRLAALCPDHESRYLDLANVLSEALFPHERRRSPGLPPFARPAVESVGGRSQSPQ